MGIKEDERSTNNLSIGDFYNCLQSRIIVCDEMGKLCHITSRSTTENKTNIQNVCSSVKYNCQTFCIPTEGVFLKKTELSVKAFKYLVCNTKFDSQSLLADDTANGHLVDMHPPYSVYLLMEIIWHCNFEDILAESILHFPLDICMQILEVLPRCIDLLDFERAAKFLTTIIPNAYKKLILLRDTGSQSDAIDQKAFAFSAHTVELVLQFMNSRFLKIEDMTKEEQYKRSGRLLKSIIQMVRLCLTSKTKNVEFTCQIKKLYKLTFGHAEFHKINDEQLQRLFLGIDRELISLLMKKVKEIDCNIYINWTEYDDEENTAITLQRAVGLECYFFIENTKDLVNPELKDYQHLIECLGQLASKPENSMESMQLEDLANGLEEGKAECLVALFRRYKEWDDAIVDSIDSHICLLTKDDCQTVFEYLSDEIVSQTHPEKLQSCLLCLSKALVFLQITELYEITMKFIMKFGENDNLENVIDISNFERFISLNPNISVSKNLRVVLFFLCLKPKATLKILLKMAIGHADYPDVAVSIDDLMLLEPIMKIQTHSQDDTLIDALRYKCSETTQPNYQNTRQLQKNKITRPATVSLVVRILQDICLDAAEWNFIKFASLLQELYTFCKLAEFIWEIFVPFLLSERCTVYHLYYILVELQKLYENPNMKYSVVKLVKTANEIDVECQRIVEEMKWRANKDTASVAKDALIKRGIWLVKSTNISRYIVNDCLSIIQHLLVSLCQSYSLSTSYQCNYYWLISNGPIETTKLKFVVDRMTVGHQSMIGIKYLSQYPVQLLTDDVIRFIMTKCTKKNYLEYVSDMITGCVVPSRQNDSKAIKCDWVIQLTLETCLLCLEFPMVVAIDSLSFLLRCLALFLSTVLNTQKKLNQKLCVSLDTHLQIFKPVAGYTMISEAYDQLIDKCQQFKHDLPQKIKALEIFANACNAENDKLNNYERTNSPLAIKLYFAHDVVTMSLDQDLYRQEEYIQKLGQYFKKPDESSK